MERPDSATHFRGIDIIKFIMAFCVVMIHIPPLIYGVSGDKSYPQAIVYIIRLAVPFFFACSGYLMARKMATFTDDAQKKRYILGKIKNLLKIYCYWLIIYLPLSFFAYIYMYESFGRFLSEYCRILFLRGQTFYSWPLWYLYSLIITLTLILILRKVKFHKLLISLVSAGVLCLIWLQCVTDFIPHQLTFCTEYSLGGALPVMLGMYLYRIRGRLKNLWLFNGLGLAVSVLLFYFNLPFSVQVGGMVLANIGLSWNARISEKTALNLREQSMWVFFTHMYVLYIMLRWFSHIDYFPSAYVVEPVALLLSFALGLLLTWIQKFRAFSKIKVLIR